MRKFLNVFVAIVLFLGALSACAPAPKYPEGSVTVHRLLDELERYQPPNILRVVEYHQEYLIVELNGERYNIIPDSTTLENTIYWLNFDKWNVPYFGFQDLFSVHMWDLEKEQNPNLEYYVFRNDINVNRSGQTTEETQGIVLADVRTMPKIVDPATWQGTQVTIVIWEYPRIYPMVVQNMDTGEIALITSAVALDENGVYYYLNRGTSLWGYVYSEPDIRGFPYLIIRRLPR